MTKEEKQLLIKDLCGRLLYGVKICVDGYICTLLDINTEMGDKLNGETFHTVGFNKPNGDYNFCTISEVKPYLRPMSSMTDEEYNEYNKEDDLDVKDSAETLKANLKAKSRVRISKWYHGTDWLNAHHFDYRGLIENGLAIEAPEEMYNN